MVLNIFKDSIYYKTDMIPLIFQKIKEPSLEAIKDFQNKPEKVIHLVGPFFREERYRSRINIFYFFELYQAFKLTPQEGRLMDNESTLRVELQNWLIKNAITTEQKARLERINNLDKKEIILKKIRDPSMITINSLSGEPSKIIAFIAPLFMNEEYRCSANMSYFIALNTALNLKIKRLTDDQKKLHVELKDWLTKNAATEEQKALLPDNIKPIEKRHLEREKN